MTFAAAVAFAQANGYEGAEYAGTWRGYEVYRPVPPNSTGRPQSTPTGLPFLILRRGGEIRMSGAEEALQYIEECCALET